MTTPQSFHSLWSWIRPLPWWKFGAWAIPTTLSVVSLYVTFRDRRPRLALIARKGDEWYGLKQGKTVRGMEIIFSGVVEVYNTSGRANAIKSYEFFYRGGDGSWKEMESRRYEVSPDIYNATPLAVAPYSGTEWKVMAFSWHEQRPFDLDILIAVEDLFGKRSTVIVKARA